MRPLRVSIPAVQTPLRLRGNPGTRLPIRPFQAIRPAQRIPLTQFPVAAYGVRHFGLSRLKAADDTLERLEIREGKDLGNDKKTNERRRLEEMNKGKLLTTPSRLFKLLMPLTTIDHNPNHRADEPDIEPIAVLIHPQQPLSYLERLIQSEVPKIRGENGHYRPPSVSFIALQLEQDAIRPRKAIYENTDTEARKLGEGESDAVLERRRRPDDSDDTYSYLREPEESQAQPERRFVRWSQSTEIGDFIRDAARTQEFIVSIEGAPAGLGHIRVTVPSFDERTYFLRMRLRKISGRIQSIAEIKHDCDVVAHRGAQRVAIGGFGILSFWWCLVYKLTFGTELGWDTMEPVTYLASLSTLMGGYLWFLYHNREISYRSALDFTISARQKKLYQAKGVDLRAWGFLIDEGNALRKEIKSIAAEYDADWDEIQDEQDESVTHALKKERLQKNGKQEKKDDEDQDADD
ncbi:uncharacterized protein ASPGLDRAFT_62674 [Aspergillus glaucus CBS 516.65]|uniref:Calcium uniporter protein n=1 Tax=Aspergillus glaucus CBS 516.65 TaxID=1160497 RepID=A0A1L9VYV2_ASPGL|nr:hypothetical protein ASPGLDRAFT_62674 [Aspergillus glaucus CBS 516.65]OJJ89094.1 hypothetical protein ASPGLDRAFT_62674 [Aspergillus glaucus CBS 516.65]